MVLVRKEIVRLGARWVGKSSRVHGRVVGHDEQKKKNEIRIKEGVLMQYDWDF